MAGVINWLCIQCGHPLGEVIGGELNVGVPEGHARTRGANLSVRCPECGAEKIWYTGDIILKAVYQLVDAVVAVITRRMLEVASGKLMDELRELEKSK
jgi:ribosomal protein S27E